MNDLTFSRSFFKGTAVCAFLSALTTFGVHLLPLLHPAPTFEEQVLLYINPLYLIRLWVVLIHILLVLGSMWGFAGAKFRNSPGLVGFGLAGYLIFGLAELFRVSLVMNAVNGWRAAYVNAFDPAVREFVKENLLSWPQLNDALFFLLVLGFFIGNLFYAFATRKGAGLEKVISILLFVWAGVGLMSILNEFLGQGWLGFVPEFVSYTYQPLVRIMIGIWLWSFGARRNSSLRA